MKRLSAILLSVFILLLMAGQGLAATGTYYIAPAGSIGTISATPTSGHAGSGYNIGDVLIISTGGTNAYVNVTGTNAGVVTSLAMTPASLLPSDGTYQPPLYCGSGYSVGTGNATTNLIGTGSGCQVDITGIMGSNTSSYNTWAKAANIPQTIRVYVNSHRNTNDIVNVAPGSFNTGITIDADYGSDIVTYQGAGRTNTLFNFTTGVSLFLDGTGSSGAVTINDMGIGGNAGNIAFSNSARTAAFNMNRVDFIGEPGHTSYLIRSSQQTNKSILNACRLLWRSNTTPIYTYSATNNIDFDECISQNAGSESVNQSAGQWEFDSGGTINLNNTYVFDSRTNGINANNASLTLNLNNGAVQGGIAVNTAFAVNKSAGTVNNNNCLILQNPFATSTKLTSGCTDNAITQSLYNSNPLFKGAAKGGIIMVTVDDAANFDYAGRIAPILAKYGFKATFVTPITGIPAASDLQALVAGGTLSTSTVVPPGVIEVGSHSYSHTPLAYQYALNFTQTGGTSPTVTFDGTTITCTASGGDYTVTCTTTGKSFGYIINQINGVKGWTCALSSTSSQNPLLMSNSTLASSLATLVTTAAPCDIQFANGVGGQFFVDEEATPRTTMTNYINPSGTLIDPQTGLPYVCNSFGAPYDGNCANGVAELLTAGYTSGRSNLSTLYPYLAALGSYHDMYQTMVYTNSLKGANDAATAANARAFGFAVAQSGLVLSFLSHYDAQYLPHDLDVIFAEWAKIPGLQVTSLQLGAAYIRSLWTDTGSGIFTRVWDMTPIPNNYKLQAGSPCIKAGTNVSLTTDYFGGTVHNPPNIGLDDTQLSGGGLSLSLSGWNFPGWRQ